VRELAFEQTPDYKYLRSLFDNLMKEQEIDEDGVWDWVTHKQYLLDKRAEEEE
jgi:hypothetical protein